MEKPPYFFKKIGGVARVSANTEIAKQWLMRYQNKLAIIDAMLVRASALRERAYSPKTSTIDGMPHNGSRNTDRMGDIISLYTEIEEEAARETTKARAIQKEIDATIKQIKGTGSADKKLVLQMKYIDGFGWNDINDALWLLKSDFVEREDSYRRRTFKIHGAALIEISELVTDISRQEKESKKE